MAKRPIVHSVGDDGIKQVTISEAFYSRLRDARDTLRRLEAAGVDNWEGYAEAFAGIDGDLDG